MEALAIVFYIGMFLGLMQLPIVGPIVIALGAEEVGLVRTAKYRVHITLLLITLQAIGLICLLRY